VKPKLQHPAHADGAFTHTSQAKLFVKHERIRYVFAGVESDCGAACLIERPGGGGERAMPPTRPGSIAVLDIGKDQLTC